MLFAKTLQSTFPEEREDLRPDPHLFLQNFKEHAAQYIHNAYEYVFNVSVYPQVLSN